MALITCPECGKEVSDSAKICPECGYKLKRFKINKKVLIKITIPIIVVIAVSIVGTQLYKAYQAEQERLLNRQLQEETAKGIESMIDGLDSLDVQSDMVIDEIYNLYNSLDDDIKAKVSNFDKMETIEKENTISKFDEAVKRLDFDEADMLLAKISDTLDESEKEELLKKYGEWYCFSLAEQDIISSLMNPHSYTRNGGSCSFLMPASASTRLYDNEYSVTINIEYMGTNAFGGYRSKTFNEIYYFTIDTEKMAIDHAMSLSDHAVINAEKNAAESDNA